MSGRERTLRAAGIPLVVTLVSLLLTACAWRQAVRSGNEAATLSNLKTIASVEIQYFNTHGRSFGTFDQMVGEQMLDRRFAGAYPVDGYRLTLKVTAKTVGQQSAYTLNADPESSSTGTNHFYMDSLSGTIHVNGEMPASGSDPEAH